MLDSNSAIYSFEGFRLDVRKRLLLRDGQPVQLKAKAFDLLLTLVQSEGHEITKDELMERLWPNQIVEDANLTVTTSQLRKALGERAGEHSFIVTIPGRGYCFVGELKRGGALIVEQHSVSEILIEKETDHTGLPAEPIFRFGWSHDGKLFAFVRGRVISDAVLLLDTR